MLEIMLMALPSNVLMREVLRDADSEKLSQMTGWRILSYKYTVLYTPINPEDTGSLLNITTAPQ
jgi:hypothetical protein